MTSVRLNLQIRDKILQRMLEHAFGKRDKKLAADKTALGNEVYSDLYPTYIRKRMAALPEGYLPESRSQAVAFAGQVTVVLWNGLRRVAEARSSYHPAKAYDAVHVFTKRFFSLERESSRLKEERAKAESAARAALNSCSTVKKLLEIWPEAKPFVSDFAAPPEVRALTLSIKDLNAQLGLPTTTS